MSSLLEEAIVDAKALKEAALKNAENAVLEKYSVEVKDAIGALLEQEMDDDLGLEETTDEGEDLMEFAKDLPYAHQNEELEAPPENEIVEIDFDSLKARLDEENEVVESSDLIDATELAEEITKQEMEDAAMADQDSAEDAEEEDLNIDLTEEMLSDLIEELVVDMTPRPQGWSSMNSADNSIEQANNDAMAAAQAAHLEEDEEIEEDASTSSDVVDAKLFETKISKLTDSNTELRALIMESKNQLTKLNLENAKLVYQNKALNSASLNERQKTKIVEAISKTDSVEEAKVVFETLQSAVGAIDRKRSPKSLSEAVTRKSSATLRSRKAKKTIADPVSNRWKALAGIE